MTNQVVSHSGTASDCSGTSKQAAQKPRKSKARAACVAKQQHSRAETTSDSSGTKTAAQKPRKSKALNKLNEERQKTRDRLRKHRALQSEAAKEKHREDDREYRRQRKLNKIGKPIAAKSLKPLSR